MASGQVPDNAPTSWPNPGRTWKKSIKVSQRRPKLVAPEGGNAKPDTQVVRIQTSSPDLGRR